MPENLAFFLLYGQRFALAALCVLLYAIIFYKMFKLRNKPLPQANVAEIAKKRIQMRRLTTAVALITVTFCVPWFFTSLLQMLVPVSMYYRNRYIRYTGLVIEQIVFLTAWINPIIIITCCPEYRHMMRKMVFRITETTGSAATANTVPTANAVETF